MKIPPNQSSQSQMARNLSFSKSRSLWIAIAAIIGIVVTIMLGRWQLSRGEQKVQLLAQLEAQMSLEPLKQQDLREQLEENTKEFINRRINLNGQWNADLTVYLANRSHAGKTGFWVMTPLKLDGKTVVMVERGWVAWNPNNPNEKPTNVQTPAGSVNIEALIVERPSKMLELWGARKSSASESEPVDTQEQTYLKSAIWQNFDVSLFESQTGLKLCAVVHQIGSPSEGLIRELPAQGISADKNFGYAVQWFLLSALITGLYLWFQWIKPYIHARQQ